MQTTPIAFIVYGLFFLALVWLAFLTVRKMYRGARQAIDPNYRPQYSDTARGRAMEAADRQFDKQAPHLARGAREMAEKSGNVFKK